MSIDIRFDSERDATPLAILPGRHVTIGELHYTASEGLTIKDAKGNIVIAGPERATGGNAAISSDIARYFTKLDDEG